MGEDGEARLRRQLERALELGSVHGAYLIEGPAGSGKRRTAVWFAGRLLGRELALAEDEYEALPFHPDLKWVRPDGGWIRVDAIRELQTELGLVANERGRRVAVIDGAECLRLEAANALLKTLEEPPRGAVVILVASSSELLPRTVRSRVVRFRLPHWDEAELRGVLESEGFAPGDAWLAAALGGTSPEAARSWAGLNLEQARALLEALESIPGASASALLDFADGFRGGDARARTELLIAVHGALAHREAGRSADAGDRAALACWLDRYEAGQRARRELARRNLNPQLVVEGLLLELRP
jgi:DNA polymerase-3 subunit delta'